MKKSTFNNFLIYTTVFSLAIFIIDSFCFDVENKQIIEEEFMEKQIETYIEIEEDNSIISDTEANNLDNTENLIIEDNEDSKKILEEIIEEQKIEQDKKLEEQLNSAKNIDVKYILEEFEKTINPKIKIAFYAFLRSDIFSEFYDSINLELSEDKQDVRGKMKERTIKMYGVNELSREEFLSVFIHEFAHFLDLYYLEKRITGDISNKFYDIAWLDTKIIKQGLTQNDFVSGYSMTNKYEDFAETFTFFVLHNEKFIEKVSESEILEKKYEFFMDNIFVDNLFLDTSFSNDEILKDYYRDITKIEINLQNFLKYIKK